MPSGAWQRPTLATHAGALSLIAAASRPVGSLCSASIKAGELTCGFGNACHARHVRPTVELVFATPLLFSFWRHRGQLLSNRSKTPQTLVKLFQLFVCHLLFRPFRFSLAKPFSPPFVVPVAFGHLPEQLDLYLTEHSLV